MVFFIQEKLKSLKWEGWVAFGGGLLGVLMGILVLIGWWSHTILLIQLSPDFVAMQFNTALVIFFSGLGLFSLSLNWAAASQSFCTLGGGIAFLTALQYLFGFDFGIDQIFHTYDLSEPMTHPGRMAFNTSAALFSTNLAIISLNHRKNFLLSLLSSILSILVVSVAFTSFIGHLTGLEAILGFIDFARMAVHTAVACLVLGSSTFIYAIRTSWDSRMSYFALPAAIVIGMLAATLAVWQIFRAQEHFAMQSVANTEAKNLQNTFNEELQNELNTIKRMVDRWEALGGYSSALWTIDSYNYVRGLIGLDEVAIYNQALKPENRTLKGTYASIPPFETLSQQQVDSIRKENVVTAPSHRKDCLLIYYPMMVKHELKGVLAASINLIAILNAEIKRGRLGNYLISLLYQNQLIFSGGDLHSPIVGVTVKNEIAPSFGPWQIAMTLTKSVSLKGYKSLDLIILATGLIVTALGGGLVFVGQRIRIQKKELERVNGLLQEASERADAANVAKGIFLATMSHEIRTPLNAIVGTIELLTETEISPLQKKYLDRVVLSSKILLDLIGDILDFSKIEAGGVMLELIPADLLSIVKTVAENLSLKAKEKKIDIYVQCPSQPLPPLLLDPIRLQQILSNLGNNSYKFTDKGYLFFRIILKATLTNHLLIRFEVIDTGIGISPEDQTKLFQKFTQIEKTQSRKYGGVGLGLSICKKLIDLMKGEIGIISQTGKGSTFWVEIAFEIGGKLPSSSYSLAGQSILLLDEKEKEREIVKKYLTDWGARVFEEKNEEKIDWVVSTSIDPEQKKRTVLITDQPGLVDGAAAVVNRPIFPNELFKCFEGKQ